MSAIVWDLPEPFTIDLVVGEDDIDHLGHTNNTVYHVWCERVAWAHSAAKGLAPGAWQELDRAMAMRRSEALFLAPSFAGESVRVGNWIVGCDGRLRATRRFQIVRVSDAVTLMRAQSEWVCIEISSGRPKRMPETFQSAYVVEEAVRDALAREVRGPFEGASTRSERHHS